MEKILKTYKFQYFESLNQHGTFKKRYTRTIAYQIFVVCIYPHLQRFDISTPEKMLFSGEASEFDTAMKNIISQAESCNSVTI